MAGCAAPKDRPDPRRSQPQLAAARMRPGSEGPKKADFSYDSRPMGFGPATSGVEGRARDRRAEGMGWGGGEKQESERGKMGGSYREMKLFRIRGKPRAKTSTFGDSRGATEKRNCVSGPRRKRN